MREGRAKVGRDWGTVSGGEVGGFCFPVSGLGRGCRQGGEVCGLTARQAEAVGVV
jgi:hypothetical protein